METKRGALRGYIIGRLSSHLVLDEYDEKRMPFVLVEVGNEEFEYEEGEDIGIKIKDNIEFSVFWFGRFSANEARLGEARKVVDGVIDDIVRRLEAQENTTLTWGTTPTMGIVEAIKVNGIHVVYPSVDEAIGAIQIVGKIFVEQTIGG